jgi:hypothetical protein
VVCHLFRIICGNMASPTGFLPTTFATATLHERGSLPCGYCTALMTALRYAIDYTCTRPVHDARCTARLQKRPPNGLTLAAHKLAIGAASANVPIDLRSVGRRALEEQHVHLVRVRVWVRARARARLRKSSMCTWFGLGGRLRLGLGLELGLGLR